MSRTLPPFLLVLAGLITGCGGEATTEGPDAGAPKPDATLSQAELQPLFVGTWDYGMRYPSGDEIANVRLINQDGTGSQWNKETGEASKQDFKWEITEDGKTLKLDFGGLMISEYGIVSATAAQHVLQSVHGLDETCVKR